MIKMNKEIKGILELVKFELKLEKWIEPLGFNKEYWKLLYDYITNLQEENENITKLKERYQLEKECYTQRIDKAIEILKLCNSKCAKETIEILQGSDEE